MAGSFGRGTVGISLASLLLAGLVAGGTPVRRAVTSDELVAPPEIGWGETEADEIAERAEFFFAERAFPGITIPAGAYERSVAQARRLRNAGDGPDGLRWSPLGPRPIDVAYEPIYQGKGPITGRVTSIATHPFDPDVAYAATPVGVCYGPRDIGCVRLPIVSGAVAIELEISDSTGQRVAASVYQYDPRDRYKEHDFCGSTAKPVPLLEDVDSLGVWIYQGPCADGSPAAATRGEIKVTYVFPN